jgi:hypothetical protein
VVLNVFLLTSLPLPAPYKPPPFVPPMETLNYEVERVAGEVQVSFLTEPSGRAGCPATARL